jgi:hypothetical protein
MTIKKHTIAELRVMMLNQLNSLQDEDEVTFAGGLLTFNRVKVRGPVTGKQLVDVEFNEIITVQSP